MATLVVGQSGRYVGQATVGGEASAETPALHSSLPTRLGPFERPRRSPGGYNVAATTSYTLTAEQGSYALTGQETGLRAARRLTAEQGAYALNGQDAGLRAARRIVADQGSYALNGQDAALRATRQITLEQGAYALTGQDAGLRRGITLVADQGGYTLTGQAAGLAVGRRLVLDQGSYSLSGQDVDLIYSGAGAKILTADQGSYALTGQDIGLRADRRVTLEQGSYSLSGQDAALTYTPSPKVLIAEHGTYTIFGQDVELLAPIRELPRWADDRTGRREPFDRGYYRWRYARELERLRLKKVDDAEAERAIEAAEAAEMELARRRDSLRVNVLGRRVDESRALLARVQAAERALDAERTRLALSLRRRVQQRNQRAIAAAVDWLARHGYL
jgi:hypothetical protein